MFSVYPLYMIIHNSLIRPFIKVININILLQYLHLNIYYILIIYSYYLSNISHVLLLIIIYSIISYHSINIMLSSIHPLSINLSIYIIIHSPPNINPSILCNYISSLYSPHNIHNMSLYYNSNYTSNSHLYYLSLIISLFSHFLSLAPFLTIIIISYILSLINNFFISYILIYPHS